MENRRYILVCINIFVTNKLSEILKMFDIIFFKLVFLYKSIISIKEEHFIYKFKFFWYFYFYNYASYKLIRLKMWNKKVKKILYYFK